MEQSLKQLDIDPDKTDAPFSLRLLKKSMNVYQPSWDITVEAVIVLIALGATVPGKLLHAIDTINPRDGETVTTETVSKRLLQRLPYDSDREWDAAWAVFREQDQRRAFKVGSKVTA